VACLLMQNMNKTAIKSIMIFFIVFPSQIKE